MLVRPWSWTLLALLALGAGAARAQPCNRSPSSADLGTARSLFVAAAQDVEGYRWADAIPKFERSYALSCAPSALFNLAMALRALGRHREARDAFDRLLAEHSTLDGEMRGDATRFRREEAARVAVLVLAGMESLQPELRLDGEPVADSGERPLPLETDAGTHSLVARIPDHQPFTWEGRIGDGQRETIEVRFEPIVTGGGVDATPIVLTIVALALAGAGIGIGYYVWDQSLLRPLNPDRSVTIEGR